MKKNKLKTGVIGIGNMGKYHVRTYLEMKDVDLVSISDIDKNKYNELYKKFRDKCKCKFYKDYKEMINKEDLDLVSIVVPTIHHKTVAIDCLNKKINVLLEKPIANNIDDAREIIEAAKKNKVILTIGHIERHNPSVLKLKEIIDSGELGTINSIIVRRVGVMPPQIKDANVIIDLSVHDIDVVNYLINKEKPNNICVSGGKALLQNRIDYADIFMKYNSISVLLQSNWITPVKIRKINITGSKGYAELNYITQELILFETEVTKIPTEYNDFVIKFGKPVEKIINVEKEQPLKKEIRNIINTIKGKEKIRVSPEEALNALKIALEINEKLLLYANKS